MDTVIQRCIDKKGFWTKYSLCLYSCNEYYSYNDFFFTLFDCNIFRLFSKIRTILFCIVCSNIFALRVGMFFFQNYKHYVSNDRWNQSNDNRFQMIFKIKNLLRKHFHFYHWLTIKVNANQSETIDSLWRGIYISFLGFQYNYEKESMNYKCYLCSI